MKKTTLAVVVVLSLGLTTPALGKTYKYPYPYACSEMWPAVKATLSSAENYAQVKPEDNKMTASYQPKHEVHFDVSGVVLQRMNKVTLVPFNKGTGCEMQIVSNWSGWGHEDQGDFKKRVEESMAKLKATPAADEAKPADESRPAKPETPATEPATPAKPAK